MSESVPEGTAGDTGVAADPTAGTDPSEDQSAEEALHGVMQETDPDELAKQVRHWQRTAQRHERTARDNSAAATRLRQLEDASKTEVQRAVDAQQAAERERDAAMSQNARVMAAAAHSVPELADFLGDG